MFELNTRLMVVVCSGILMTLLFSGCVRDRVQVKQPPVLENSLQAICEQRNIPWQWDSVSQILTFTSQGAPAKVLVGSRVVLVGTKDVILDGTVERKANMIIVPPDFMSKVFGKSYARLPVLTQIPSITGKYREIMIDAGHGGKDPGAQGLSGTVEKDIVFDIARRLKINLENMGFHVDMTRDSDEFISLQERTEIATRSKADLFVSIHANASKSRKTKGLEIYYSRTPDRESDLTQHNLNERMLLGHLDIPGNKTIPQRIVADMMYTNKLQESSGVADLVISKTAQNISAINRGSRTCGFFVVKNTLIPAVLFEVGYISNAAEAKLLKTEEYRQKIADAIAESIKEYSHES